MANQKIKYRRWRDKNNTFQMVVFFGHFGHFDLIGHFEENFAIFHFPENFDPSLKTLLSVGDGVKVTNVTFCKLLLQTKWLEVPFLESRFFQQQKRVRKRNRIKISDFKRGLFCSLTRFGGWEILDSKKWHLLTKFNQWLCYRDPSDPKHKYLNLTTPNWTLFSDLSKIFIFLTKRDV